MTTPYIKALNRNDLSNCLIHLTKDTTKVSAFDILKKILEERKIKASKSPFIVKYEPLGASCFYDVPYLNWKQLIESNPNERKGYGIIIHKNAFWRKGGRPAIYTDNPDTDKWESTERYRLIKTSLNEKPPIDWTHEREWRVKDDLTFDGIEDSCLCCVENIKDCQNIFEKYSGMKSIYIVELERVLLREEILICSHHNK